MLEPICSTIPNYLSPVTFLSHFKQLLYVRCALCNPLSLSVNVLNHPSLSFTSHCVSPPPPLLFSPSSSFQMQFMLLFSRQGKLRLQKWYVPLSDKEKKKITRELVQTVLARKPKMCSFLEWRDLKIVYKR